MTKTKPDNESIYRHNFLLPFGLHNPGTKYAGLALKICNTDQQARHPGTRNQTDIHYLPTTGSPPYPAQR